MGRRELADPGADAIEAKLDEILRLLAERTMAKRRKHLTPDERARLQAVLRELRDEVRAVRIALQRRAKRRHS